MFAFNIFCACFLVWREFWASKKLFLLLEKKASNLGACLSLNGKLQVWQRSYKISLVRKSGITKMNLGSHVVSISSS